MHTCEIEQLVCIAKGRQTKRSNSRPDLHHSPVSSGSYGSGAGVRKSVRGGVPRRVGRLAGAAWRQPALDAARRARRCGGWGAHGGPVRRRAAESRHCGSRGGKLAVLLWGWERIWGEECWMRMAGRGRRVGKKRAGAGGARARSRADRERVFGFARERESTNVLWRSSLWVQGRWLSKIVCARACMSCDMSRCTVCVSAASPFHKSET